MNTGIDDVANLAWKLAGNLRGWGGPKLVESYDVERRPIGMRNAHAASAIADTLGEFPIPSDIERSDSAGEEARDIVVRAIEHVKVKEFGTIGVQLGVRYEASPSSCPMALPSPRQPHRLCPNGPPGLPAASLLAGWILSFRPARRGLHAARFEQRAAARGRIPGSRASSGDRTDSCSDRSAAPEQGAGGSLCVGEAGWPCRLAWHSVIERADPPVRHHPRMADMSFHDEDLREYERLVREFAWGVDHFDDEAVLELFTQDVIIEQPGRVIQGRDAFAEMLASRPRTRATRHLISNCSVIGPRGRAPVR